MEELKYGYSQGKRKKGTRIQIDIRRLSLLEQTMSLEVWLH
jgi:hypothetical protein